MSTARCLYLCVHLGYLRTEIVEEVRCATIHLSYSFYIKNTDLNHMQINRNIEGDKPE